MSWFKRVMRRRRRQIADSAVATSTATSPLSVDVEAAPDANTFVCVTISNTRAGASIPDPEDCFIPFKQKGGGPCIQCCVSVVCVEVAWWAQVVRGSLWKPRPVTWQPCGRCGCRR
jgi:hypothetical protein